MRYTVTRQLVQVIGYIWQPGTGICAMEQNLSEYDLSNIEDARDRSSVEQWITTHFGDFQSIKDFRADLHIGNKHIVHRWAEVESDLTYNDCMFPSDE